MSLMVKKKRIIGSLEVGFLEIQLIKFKVEVIFLNYISI